MQAYSLGSWLSKRRAKVVQGGKGGRGKFLQVFRGDSQLLDDRTKGDEQEMRQSLHHGHKAVMFRSAGDLYPGARLDSRDHAANETSAPLDPGTAPPSGLQWLSSPGPKRGWVPTTSPGNADNMAAMGLCFTEVRSIKAASGLRNGATSRAKSVTLGMGTERITTSAKAATSVAVCGVSTSATSDDNILAFKEALKPAAHLPVAADDCYGRFHSSTGQLQSPFNSPLFLLKIES